MKEKGKIATAVAKELYTKNKEVEAAKERAMKEVEEAQKKAREMVECRTKELDHQVELIEKAGKESQKSSC